MSVTRNVPRTEFAAEVRSECCKSVTYLAFLAHSSVNHFLYNVMRMDREHEGVVLILHNH